MKCRPAVGAAAEPSVSAKIGLVALGVARPAANVRRQRRRAGGQQRSTSGSATSGLHRNLAQSFGSDSDDRHRQVVRHLNLVALAQSARRTAQRLPTTLRRACAAAAARRGRRPCSLPENSRRQHARAIGHQQVARLQQVRQVANMTMARARRSRDPVPANAPRRAARWAPARCVLEAVRSRSQRAASSDALLYWRAVRGRGDRSRLGAARRTAAHRARQPCPRRRSCPSARSARSRR